MGTLSPGSASATTVAPSARMAAPMGTLSPGSASMVSRMNTPSCSMTCFILETVEGDPDSEVKLESVAQLPSNTKVKQVIEQDGVFILETMEADPGDSVPMGAAILAEGATVVAEADPGDSVPM